MVFAPAQLFPVGNLLIEAVANGVTVIVITFDVAGLPVVHVAFDVTTQLIALVFANAASVYVALLVPTFVAPFFHW